MARKPKDWKLWEIVISHPPDPAVIEKRWARSKKEARNFVRRKYYGPWTFDELEDQGVIFSGSSPNSHGENRALKHEYKKIVRLVVKEGEQFLLPMALPVNPRF